MSLGNATSIINGLVYKDFLSLAWPSVLMMKLRDINYLEQRSFIGSLHESEASRPSHRRARRQLPALVLMTYRIVPCSFKIGSSTVLWL